MIPNSTCARCGRPLSDPFSIKIGLGPVCLAKSATAEAPDRTHDQFIDTLPVTRHGLICRRVPDGVATNVHHTIVRHSPSGFEWGYGGSGPADLALNTLAAFLPVEIAELIYQDFKREVIAAIPPGGGEVSLERINEWLAANVGAAGCEEVA